MVWFLAKEMSWACRRTDGAWRNWNRSWRSCHDMSWPYSSTCIVFQGHDSIGHNCRWHGDALQEHGCGMASGVIMPWDAVSWRVEECWIMHCRLLQTHNALNSRLLCTILASALGPDVKYAGHRGFVLWQIRSQSCSLSPLILQNLFPTRTYSAWRAKRV